MAIKIKKVIHQTYDVTLSVSRETLVELLKTEKEAEKYLDDKSSYLLKDVFVRVPGGADWSNTDLAIDADTPLQLRLTATKVEEINE